MTWTRGISLIGIVSCALFCIRSCDNSQEKRDIQEHARSIVAIHGDMDTNPEDQADITKGDLSALILAWRMNYAETPSMRFAWFASCAFSLVVFTVIFAIGGKKSSNQRLEGTAGPRTVQPSPQP